MAFYARKNGIESFRFAKTRKDCRCFLCDEFIAKGTYRYASGSFLSMCTKCADCWEKEGGMLGDISRAKK